jgi:glycosyltransferase involved in cell wall biosynthesis
MENTMKASIVIPAHNEAGCIRSTLEAVRFQYLPGEEYEIIVVDNASTDETPDIARGFHGVRVIHESRKGLLHAREAGRKAARGEIIVQLDADSIPMSDWLARGIAYFADPAVVCVSGPYYYYDGNLSFRWMSYAYQVGLLWTTHQLLSPSRRACVGMGGNMFIRASALEAAGGYDITIPFYGEDTNTARRMMGQGKVYYVMGLWVYSSARRFKRMGVVLLVWTYSLNWFWEIVFKRPYNSDEHQTKKAK